VHAYAYAHSVQLIAVTSAIRFHIGFRACVAVALCQKQETICMLTVHIHPTTGVPATKTLAEPGNCKGNTWMHMQAQAKLHACKQGAANHMKGDCCVCLSKLVSTQTFRANVAVMQCGLSEAAAVAWL